MLTGNERQRYDDIRCRMSYCVNISGVMYFIIIITTIIIIIIIKTSSTGTSGKNKVVYKLFSRPHKPLQDLIQKLFNYIHHPNTTVSNFFIAQLHIKEMQKTCIKIMECQLICKKCKVF